MEQSSTGKLLVTSENYLLHSMKVKVNITKTSEPLYYLFHESLILFPSHQLPTLIKAFKGITCLILTNYWRPLSAVCNFMMKIKLEFVWVICVHGNCGKSFQSAQKMMFPDCSIILLCTKM